jgi:EGF-like domain.
MGTAPDTDLNHSQSFSIIIILFFLSAHCDGDPCMNGATCNEVREGYECVCPTGFKGTDCEGKI